MAFVLRLGMIIWYRVPVPGIFVPVPIFPVFRYRYFRYHYQFGTVLIPTYASVMSLHSCFCSNHAHIISYKIFKNHILLDSNFQLRKD
ncbi:hypothetical protein Hanom_Chr07g00600741 [Helianthus anomalus]